MNLNHSIQNSLRLEAIDVDAPLCACGCRTPVIWRRGKWNTYASVQCAGRVTGKLNRDRESMRIAQRIWVAERTAKRQEDLLSLITEVARGLTPIDVAVKQLDAREQRAYHRGVMGKRRHAA